MKPQSSQRHSEEFTTIRKYTREVQDKQNISRCTGSIVRIVDGKLVRVAHVFSHHPPEYLIK